MPPKQGPQLGDGFTRVHNDLLALFALLPFTARQYKVLLHVVRLTWGFNRTEAKTTAYDVAHATGLSAQHARTTITDLHRARVLKVRGSMVARKAFTIALNKYYLEWRGDFALPVSAERFIYQTVEQPVQQTVEQPGEKEAPKPAPQADSSEPKDKKDKKDIKDNQPSSSGEEEPFGFGEHAGPPKPAKAPPPEPGANDPLNEPLSPPAQNPLFIGLDLAIHAFLQVYDRGGAVLPHTKLQDLKDTCEALNMTAAEVGAHIQAWAQEYRNAGKKVPRIGSPTYFQVVIPNRLGKTKASTTPGHDPYGDYV